MHLLLTSPICRKSCCWIQSVVSVVRFRPPILDDSWLIWLHWFLRRFFCSNCRMLPSREDRIWRLASQINCSPKRVCVWTRIWYIFQPLYLNAQFHNYWFKTLEILSPYFSPKIKSNTQRDLLWVTFKREEFTGIFCSPLSDYMYSYMIKEGVLRKS